MFRHKKSPSAFSVTHQGNKAFHLYPSVPGKAGILLIHGFTASPWEMRPLGEILCRAGYTVAAVRLPGHGTSPEDLSQRRYEEWIEAARRTCDTLQQENDHVHAMGISTGALVSAALASEKPLSSLILLSPFLAMRHRLAPFTGALRHVRKYQSRELPDHLTDFYYDRRPLNGVYQICRLIRHVRPVLPRITTPTLAVNALGDRTVKFASGYDLFLRLGSPRKEYHLFGPQTGHGLATPDHPSWQAMLDLIQRFLRDMDHLQSHRG